MWPSRANLGLRPLGRFAPVAVNSGLCPETQHPLLQCPHEFLFKHKMCEEVERQKTVAKSIYGIPLHTTRFMRSKRGSLQNSENKAR